MSNKQTTNKQPVRLTPQQAIAEAERVIAGLEQKRQTLAERKVELAAMRERLSYSAHAGLDAEASRELSAARTQALDAEQQLVEIDAALTTARFKLNEARAVEARDERRVQLKEQQKHSKQYRELGPFLDRALDHLQRGLAALSKNANAVGRDHRHVFTTHRVIACALDATVFKGVFPVPDSGDKRAFPSFSHVINQWCDNFDANLKQELEALDDVSDKQTEAA